MPHPRGYGNNARVLGRYVREMKTLRLGDAIRKMTSLPANTFRLKDRGGLLKGRFLGGHRRVRSRESHRSQATYNDPHHYADRHPACAREWRRRHCQQRTHTGRQNRDGTAPRSRCQELRTEKSVAPAPAIANNQQHEHRNVQRPANWGENPAARQMEIHPLQRRAVLGAPMFFVMTFFVNRRADRPLTPEILAVSAVLWALGGFLFGLTIWTISERRYQKFLATQIKRQPKLPGLAPVSCPGKSCGV